MVSWEGRNIIIANLIPAGSRVIDLGAGDMNLASHLKDCKYIGYDKNPQHPSILKCDFDVDTPEPEHGDYVVISGVLEYLNFPMSLIKRVKGLADKMIVTYSPLDGQTREDRRKSGWISHLTREQLEGSFSAMGLKYEAVSMWNEQVIYSLQRK